MTQHQPGTAPHGASRLINIIEVREPGGTGNFWQNLELGVVAKIGIGIFNCLGVFALVLLNPTLFRIFFQRENIPSI